MIKLMEFSQITRAITRAQMVIPDGHSDMQMHAKVNVMAKIQA